MDGIDGKFCEKGLGSIPVPGVLCNTSTKN